MGCVDQKARHGNADVAAWRGSHCQGTGGSKAVQGIAHEAADDDLETEVYEELKGYAKEFETLALQVMDYCYRQDDDRAQQLLTYQLKNWSKQTCLSLAVADNHRALLSHTCCQILLADLWLGGLRTRKNTNIKVMLSLLIPPLVLLLGFRSREELKTMPQTREEHQYDDPERSSDSETDTDSDDENLDLRNEQDPEVKAQLVNSVSLPSHPVTPTLQPEAPLCNSSSAGPIPSTLVVPPVPDAASLSDEHPSSLRHNGVSGGHLSVLDSSVFLNHSKQLPARIKFYEFFNAPITKFWAHSIAYGFFLCLFTYVVLVKLPKRPQWMEWYVIAYISTLLLEKVREILSTEPVELKLKIAVWSDKLWNVCDLVFGVLFMIGMTLRLQEQTMQAGRVIYCVDIIYWYLRILEILSANKYLGPLVMMMGKMIKNMAYFVVLLLVVLMAFGVCRQSILYPNEEPHWRLARHIFYQPYFMLYGEVFAGDIDPECGGTDQIPCHPGRWLTPTVMSMYLLVANILLINLLIAVFNNIFQEVNAISHQVWMFQRFQVVMEFEGKPVFPPPLIILSHIYRVIKYFFRRWKGKPSLYDNGLKLFLDGESLERLHDFEEECMDGYNREKEQREQMSTEERVRVMAERTEGLAQRIEDMHAKFIGAMTSVNNLDFHVKRLEETVEQTKNSYAVVHRFMLSHVKQRRSGSPCSGSGSPKSDGGCTSRSVSQTSLHQMLEETEKLMSRRHTPEQEMSDKEVSDTTDAEHEAVHHRRSHKPGHCEEQIQPSHIGMLEGFNLDSVKVLSARQAKRQSRRSKQKLDSESGSSQGRGSRERRSSGGRKSSIRKSSNVSGDLKPVYSPKVCFMDDTENISGHQSPPKYERCLSNPNQPIIQVIPPSSPPQIFTFASEYTSLADELETVCRLSPPSSPRLHFQGRGSTPVRHRYLSESAGIAITISSNPLRDAEEADYQLMEGLIQRRMHRDSENLAVSLEDLCSVKTEYSDGEDGGCPHSARRDSRATELRKRHSTSIDNNLSDVLSVPRSTPLTSSRILSPTGRRSSFVCGDSTRLALSQPNSPNTRRSSIHGEMHQHWASSSALPVSEAWERTESFPRPHSPPCVLPQVLLPVHKTQSTADASHSDNQPFMATLHVPGISEIEARPKDSITETEYTHGSTEGNSSLSHKGGSTGLLLSPHHCLRPVTTVHITSDARLNCGRPAVFSRQPKSYNNM
ncbi:Transient receptor potential cation channel trpm [Chionoecetes opilio]|uniref:Transient receptor potential cation channel trpm n=1 Tax=Chionoecetes opilio TaxID=41210 RepID=A0A8J5BUH6_CHIOP|nr:Transient receptor potential cation channel trpm [Chionoecetes opilio]